MSQRHEEDDPLLDAAHACVMAVGVRRTTLTDVARRAGISRMTVYRRFPDVAALIQALMTRAFSSVLSDAVAANAHLPTVRERLASGAADGVVRLSEDPLFLRLLDVDPELFLPYLVQRHGAFQHVVLDVLGALLAQGMEEGSVRRTDPAALAAALELCLRGWVIAARADDPDGLRARATQELRPILEGALR
ncbi:MAG: transcriptional regulator, TetR family [Solirubrobacterales bacterium]|jgi:AcrR family transcriptional regulator|nr:transcriptional regulator, TetR family [Solirubrobacterales bacterium]